MLQYTFLALIALFPLAVSAADPSTAALIEKGHFKRAQTILRERLKTNTNDARSYCEMSKVAISFERWDEAIQQAERAVSMDSKNPEFQTQLAEALLSRLSTSQAGFFEKMSLARRYKKEAEHALQLDPNNVDANTDLSGFYAEAPSIAGGDKKKAEELAERMVRVDPLHGYLMKVEIATQEKRAGEIEQFFQQAINADPKSYGARLQAANFYLGKGGARLAQAEEQAKQAIRLDPERIGGYNTLAALYAQQGRWTDLDSVLKDAQLSVPDDLGPLYQAAKTILLNSQTQALSRAENYLRTYLSQPPEGSEPSHVAAHWRLGLILEKEGHRDQAKQELQTAVNLDSKFEPARRDLKRLH